MAGMAVEQMQLRTGTLTNMSVSNGWCKMEFICSSRGLIGLRGELMQACRGELVMNSILHSYLPAATTPTGKGRKGAIISMANGKATAHALHSLESRGKLFIVPADEVYDGQIVGEANIQQDYEVNPGKQKQLTNIRAAGKDEFVQLAPVRKMSIEDCIGYIAEDELIEVTPKVILLLQ